MIGVGLEQVTRVLAKLETRHLVVDGEQCSRVRHKNSTCDRCTQSCPAGAITLGSALAVDVEKCIGCGICATACPTGALEASSPTNAQLLHQFESRKEDRRVTFACDKASPKNDDRAISVSCIGRLDESVLVGAASMGIGRVELVDGPCAGCSSNCGRKVAEQTVAEANRLLEAFGTGSAISFIPELPPSPAATPSSSNAGLSRRAFFTMLTRETKMAAAITVGSVLEPEAPSRPPLKKGELRHRLPARRQLLLESLRRLGEPSLPQFTSLNGTWATWHSKEACMGCQMCALFCPTTALTKVDRDGKPGIAFRVSECVGCELCRDLCYWKAMVLSPEVDLTKVIDDVFDYVACDTETTAWETSETKIRRLMSTIWKA